MAQRRRIVVVGGGLSGLVAGTLAARGGADVMVLEKATRWGGRARSDRRGEAWLNLGPHALYEAGHARRVLGSIGVGPRGDLAPAKGSLGLLGDRLVTLPVGAVSLLMTDLFTASEKLVAARVLSRLQGGAPADAAGLTLSAWLDAQRLPGAVRAFLQTAVRVSTYGNDPDRMGATAALDQLALGAKGVRYLDGGWQSLVHAVEAAADAAGVRRRHGAVRGVAVEAGAAVGVDLESGERLGADAVVLAVGPRDAARIAPASASLASLAVAAEPILASCLDLVVEQLPRPAARVCLGIDRPLYFSVHSAVAALVAPPAAVVHVARYLAPGEAGGSATRQELEAFAERVQPGLLGRVREARFLPRMTVTHALVGRGGLASRPATRVCDVDALFVVGDWVGDRGQLLDAALASAERCASLLAEEPAARAREVGGAMALELEQHRRALWGLCYGMTGSAADAEDLVQETFVRALERPPADTSREVGPWLVTVAANLSRDALRRRRRAGYVGPWLPAPLDEELAPAAEIEGEHGTESRYAIVERLGYAFLIALEALTPNQRAVLVLRDVLELSVEETARALELSVPTVKTTHHRARAALARHEAEERGRASLVAASAAIHRFAAGLATADVDEVLASLAVDARTINDGGGVFHAALRVVHGADAVARLHLGLHRRRVAAAGDGARFDLRVVSGLPALVIELPPGPPKEATRFVMLFDVGADGRIRTITSVLAPAKLSHVRWPAG